MDQPWWVYGSIAFGCAFLYLLAKVVENHFMDDEDDLGFITLVLGFIGFFAAWKAMEILNFFE